MKLNYIGLRIESNQCPSRKWINTTEQGDTL
jgi:hypothetical protein